LRTRSSDFGFDGLAFSPDANTLVAGTVGGRLLPLTGVLWSSLADLQTLVCGLVQGRTDWPQLVPGIALQTSCPS
jgi:hypothetical protein